MAVLTIKIQGPQIIMARNGVTVDFERGYNF